MAAWAYGSGGASVIGDSVGLQGPEKWERRLSESASQGLRECLKFGKLPLWELAGA